MFFRKLCQAFGIFLVALGMWQILEFGVAGWTERIEWKRSMLGVTVYFVIVGIGLLMMFLDPHKLVRNGLFTLHKTVDQKEGRKSFAEKIGVGDDD